MFVIVHFNDAFAFVIISGLFLSSPDVVNFETIKCGILAVGAIQRKRFPSIILREITIVYIHSFVKFVNSTSIVINVLFANGS